MRNRVLLVAIIALFALASSASAVDDWYNASWHYRLSVSVTAAPVMRDYWPVELDLNFTQLLAQKSDNDTFDNLSVRVLEYNAAGRRLWQVPFQFDRASGYADAGNAVGTLSFQMNGSTQANTLRRFFVYFDSNRTGIKPTVSYSSNLAYVNYSDEFNVNNTLMRFYVDTSRGENSSGLYRVQGATGGQFFAIDEPDPTARTIEFQKYSNGTHNFSFDFRNNATLVYSGPVRMVVEQRVNETYYNDPDRKTGQGFLVKRYYFYENLTWVRVTQNYSNTAGAAIVRSSTNATALALGILQAFGSTYQYDVNYSAPAPWVWGTDEFGNREASILQVNQSFIANFSAAFDNGLGIAGINLNTSTIPAGGSIYDEAVEVFNDTGSNVNNLQDLSLALGQQKDIVVSGTDAWNATVLARVNYSIFNRGEIVVVLANVTNDTYALATSANATVDNGTPLDASDDFNFTLYDDGSHGDITASDRVFTNNFTLANASAVGIWNLTVRVFNGTSILVSANSTLFNVTALYNLAVVVLNPLGLTGRQVNATVVVRNYRLDDYIPSSNVSCIFNGTMVAPSNVTDYLNGTYLVTFGAGNSPSIFNLTCSAARFDNNGTASDLFSSEAPTTTLAINATPANDTVYNISQVYSASFVAAVNLSNDGFASARAANVSLLLPAGWSANATIVSCGNINITGHCLSAFNVTVPANTSPGLYFLTFNASWGEANGSVGYNATNMTVNVTSNPQIAVSTAGLSGFIPPGSTRFIGNFTVNATGNDFLLNVTFSTTNFTQFTFNFTPANFSSIGPTVIVTVSVNVTVPAGFPTGTYDGVLNVSTASGVNASLPVQVIVSGTNVSVEVTPTYVRVDNVTTYDNPTFTLLINATNDGNVTAYAANLTFQLPPLWTVNATAYTCGNIAIGTSCVRTLNVTIANSTTEGNYTVNATATWLDQQIGNRTNTTEIIANVTANFRLNTTEANLTGNAPSGYTTTVTNFTLRSDGSGNLTNITYEISGIPFLVELFGNVTNLAGASTALVAVNATVPYAFDAGTYNGSIYINSSQGGNRNLSLSITVPANLTWILNQTECVKFESPDIGVACVVQINNTGNTQINFTVTPAGVNFTNATNATFSLDKQTSFDLAFTYNVSGVPKINRNSTYVINTTPAGTPNTRTVVVALTTFSSITSNVTVVPNFTQAGNNVTIGLNVSDDNLVGIANAVANITMPNGTVVVINLSFVDIVTGGPTNVSRWYGNYSGTQLSGTYTALALSLDNVGSNGSAAANFTIFANLSSDLFTLKDTYSVGEVASIYFAARGTGREPLAPSNVTISVRNNNSVVIFIQNYVSANSPIEPLPQFTISNDQAPGTFTLSANVSYYDTVSNTTFVESKNYSFQVVNGSSGSSGVVADVNTIEVWSPGDNATFLITVKAANGTFVPADSLNLTAYSTGGQTLFSVQTSALTIVSTGVYSYSYTLSQNTPTGNYFAQVNATYGSAFTKAFDLFTISASLHAELETDVVWYPDNTMTFAIALTDSQGGPIDATAMNLTILDNDRNIYLTVFLPNFTHRDTGLYLFSYTMPSNTAIGGYTAMLNATANNRSTITNKDFRVSSGGPFDVIIAIPNPEVSPGQYLDFTLTLQNMGDVSQDVTVDYWVSDGTRTWFSASELLFVPSQGLKTFPRSAFIFSNQPLGPYTVHVRVTYDLQKPPLEGEKSFQVRAATSSGSVGGGGGGGGEVVTPTPGILLPVATPPPYSAIEIIDYPNEILVEKGDTKFPKVTVRNTGLMALHNLQLVVSGIPSSWVEVQPAKLNVLASGDQEDFLVHISVPFSAPAGVRPIRFIALADEKKADKTSQIAIFESRAALIEYEVRRLDEKIAQITKDARSAQLLGKNVDAVWKTLEEAKNYTELAKSGLQDGLVDDALGNVRIAEVLVSKAAGLLIAAGFQAPSAEQGIAPLTVLAIIGFTILATAAGIYIYRRRQQIERALPQAAKTTEKVVEVVSVKSKEDLQEEEERISRAISLLEEELRQGSISRAAYDELRRRNDARLKKVRDLLNQQK
jgi:uncharacterized membrane protein